MDGVLTHIDDDLADNTNAACVMYFVKELLFSQKDIPISYENKKRFVDVVNEIYVIRGDKIYLQGNTLYIGHYVSDREIVQEVNRIVYVEHPQRFPEEKEKGNSYIKWIVVIVFLFLVIKGCTGC